MQYTPPPSVTIPSDSSPIESGRQKKRGGLREAVDKYLLEEPDDPVVTFKVGKRRYFLDDSTDVRTAKRRAYGRKVKQTARRYAAPMALSLVLSVAGAIVVSSFGLGAVAIGVVATVCDDAGFYAIPFVREVRKGWKHFEGLPTEQRAARALSRSLGRLAGEYGVAELFDSGSLRPVMMGLMPKLLHNVPVGVGIAKILTDIPLITIAAVSRNVRDSLSDKAWFMSMRSGMISAMNALGRPGRWCAQKLAGEPPSAKRITKAHKALMKDPERLAEYTDTTYALSTTTEVGGNEHTPVLLPSDAEEAFRDKHLALMKANAALSTALLEISHRGAAGTLNDASRSAALAIRDVVKRIRGGNVVVTQQDESWTSNEFLAKLAPLAAEHLELLGAAATASKLDPLAASDIAAAVKAVRAFRESPFADMINSLPGAESPSALFEKSTQRTVALDGTSLAPAVDSLGLTMSRSVA